MTMMKRWITLTMTILIITLPVSFARADQVYRVQPGDSIYSIAVTNQIEMDEIFKLNPYIDTPDEIKPYQVIIIPEPKEEINDTQSLETAKTSNITKRTSDTAKSSYETPRAKQFADSTKQLRTLFPGAFFLAGGVDKKQVALTFDDGPDDNFTPRIMDILEMQGVKASFFLLGSMVEKHPSVVRQLAAKGHLVANHSWSHPNLRLKTVAESRLELVSTAAAIARVIGREPLMFRPPYGELTPEIMQDASNLGYISVGWSTDSRDWYHNSSDAIIIETLKDTRNGSIILMHSAETELEDLVEALPELIFTLKTHGYEFVTLDEMLGQPAYRTSNPVTG